MDLPANKIETLETIESTWSEFNSFSESIRQKYGLSFDQMRLLDSISLEEMLALRMERMLKVFNGKIVFPIHELFNHSVTLALYRLINSYPTKKEKKRIQMVFSMSQRGRLKLSSNLQRLMKDSRYRVTKPNETNKSKRSDPENQ